MIGRLTWGLAGAALGAGAMFWFLREQQEETSEPVGRLPSLNQVDVMSLDRGREQDQAALEECRRRARKLIGGMTLQPVVSDAGGFLVVSVCGYFTGERGYIFQDLERAVDVAKIQANGWCHVMIVQYFDSRDWRICQDNNYRDCITPRVVAIANPSGSLTTA